MNNLINAEWSYKKGNNKKLMLMSDIELSDCKQHCYNMLHSNEHKKLGRLVALNNVYECLDKLHTEQFLRGFMDKYEISRANLRQLSATSPEIQYELKNSNKFIHEHLVFQGLGMNLGKVVRTTYFFILRQGVQLTEAQYKEFKGEGENSDIKLNICRELGLDDELADKIHLSKSAPKLEFVKAMLSAKDKYINTLKDEELDTLILEYIPRYIQELQAQAEFWTNKLNEINAILESR